MQKIFIGLALLLLGGCESFSGYPRPPRNVVFAGATAAQQQSVEAAEAAALTAYHSAADTSRANLSPRQYRDAYVNAELLATNRAFDTFLQKVRTQRSSFNILTTSTLLALNGLAATVGGEGTKAALGVAAGGVVGATSTVDKELFQAETLAVLIARMKAARLAALAPIRAGLDRDTGAYPLEAALVDLQAYREAGSLLSTLDAIALDAGKAAGDAQQTIVREHVYQTLRDTIATVQGRVAALDNTQVLALARAMEVRIATRKAAQRDDLAGIDPQKKHLVDPAVAHKFLDYWLETVEDNATDLAQWNTELAKVAP